MRKNAIIALVLALLLVLGACGKTGGEGGGPLPDGKGGQSGGAGTSGDTARPAAIGVANPYQEIDGATAEKTFGLRLTLPETAADAHWFDIDTGGEDGMLQLQFVEDGVQYVFRARSAARLSNISVVYASFTTEKELTVLGHKGKLGLTQNGGGVVLWFDSARSLTLALAAPQGAEEAKLLALAETLYEAQAADLPASAPTETPAGTGDSQGTGNQGTGGADQQPTEPPPPPPELGPLTVVLYLPASDGSFTDAAFTAESIDGAWVAARLKEKGVLGSGVEVLWMELMSADERGSGEIALNLNAAFGKQLKSLDARQEYMTLGSLVNSYLSAFGADRLWLYVEGNDPVSATRTYNTVLTAYGPYTEEATEPPTEAPTQKAEDPDATLAEKICALAESKIGADYEYGAAGPDTFDNSGFVYWVFQQCGVSLPRRTTEMFKKGAEVAQSDLQPGDVVFFTYEEDRSPSYVGIYLGGGRFIAENKAGNPVKIMDMTTQYFREIYIGARRYI